MREIIIVLFCIFFMLSACNNEDVQKEENDDLVEEAEAEEKEELFPVSNLATVDASRSGMKSQLGGILLEDISLEDEVKMDVEQFSSDNQVELNDHLQRLTEETKNPEELEKGLTYLLGSANYSEAIETAEEFLPDFADPELPTAEGSDSDADTVGEKVSEGKGKAILLLDASSSMLLQADGRVKMDIAKEAVQQFAEVIGQENDVSLVVYGHKGSESQSDKKLSCEGIEEVYPLGTYDENKFDESLNAFESKGWTPLAGAIDKAAEMSQSLEGEITLYVVSDGVETCDGDPINSAESFVENNAFRQVNIIGFNVDAAAEEQLKEVSLAGNGEYFAANNAGELVETIEYEWLPSRGDLAWAFTKAPGPWDILDEYNLYDVDHEKIRELIQKEDERYDQAISILRGEEMVSSEVINELNDVVSEHYTIRMDELRDLRTEKIDEIDAIADEIKQQVDDWKEEMEGKKEERGDVW